MVWGNQVQVKSKSLPAAEKVQFSSIKGLPIEKVTMEEHQNLYTNTIQSFRVLSCAYEKHNFK